MKEKEGNMSNNWLSLVRLGFFPPEKDEEAMKKHIIYILWDTFREYCRFANLEKQGAELFEILCERETGEKCAFAHCPLLRKAIKKYDNKM